MLMVYMVLMAWVDLGRMKMYAATRWLWLALSGGLFVAAPLGCDADKTPQVLYGPAPDMEVDEDADVPQVLYGPAQDVTDPGPAPDVGQDPGDTPQVMYGPVQDVGQDPGDTPQVMYGPVQDVGQDPGDVPQVLYGPPPDVVEDVPLPDSVQPLYGPVQLDAAQDTSPDDELPQVLYGPPGA